MSSVKIIEHAPTSDEIIAANTEYDAMDVWYRDIESRVSGTGREVSIPPGEYFWEKRQSYTVSAIRPRNKEILLCRDGTLRRWGRRYSREGVYSWGERRWWCTPVVLHSGNTHCTGFIGRAYVIWGSHEGDRELSEFHEVGCAIWVW